MAETRIVTIEASPKNTLYTWRVKVEADLVDRFVRVATDERGPWRSKKESFHQALEGAVTDALIKWIALPLHFDEWLAMPPPGSTNILAIPWLHRNKISK